MKNHEVDKKIEAALAREDWEGARILIARELEKDPLNHWLLARLSTTYYEQRQYAKATQLIQEAHQLCPTCPLVLWDYAGTLDALGKSKEALKIYGQLIRQGPRSLGEANPCGEGLEWALSLAIDCIFRAAVCWEHLGKKATALQWFHAFLNLRAEWGEGIHGPEEALKRIEKLSENNPRRAKNQFRTIQKELGVGTKP